MSHKHQELVGSRIPHGAASSLFPVEDLPCDIYQHRDAKRILESTPSDAVLGLRKTGLASAYFLHNHALTVVDTVSLPDHAKADILDRTGVDVHDYELLAIGNTDRNYENRTLGEYATR
ncbi:hypothetical protein [Halorubellus salinus]|uniref:hypothetical protein n=1 Tax=Halorubellus salinus TaxID=755309 RepID=UPI001D083F7B|nr:hypothetical protein [Halorubellus salinus]